MLTSDLLHCFESEWLKQRRSLGTWLIVVGALFTPGIIFVSRLMHPQQLAELSHSSSFWTSLWRSSWESMAIFFLPMAAILVTSLITQLEYRNNAWKQVLTLPLSPGVIFLGKLLVILALMAQFFVLFEAAVYLAGAGPTLLMAGVPYPVTPLPWPTIRQDTLIYMVGCLPIVALQYLLSLHLKNFLVPVGIGFLVWVGALAALPWRYGSLIPYSYTMLAYLQHEPKGAPHAPILPLPWLALGYAVAFIGAAYGLFSTKSRRG
jgi:hypothetical protein